MKPTLLYLACAMLGIVDAGAAAQNPPPPSQPAVVAPPTWTRMFTMADGRTFVTDGGMALDAAVAKPAQLPATVLPTQTATLFAGYMTAAYEREVGLADLKIGSLKNTFVTPSGLYLNGNYVNFIRSAVPPGRVRFRLKGELDPIVIALDGKPIGVLMAVRGPSR
jgi:hypothetical protein